MLAHKFADAVREVVDRIQATQTPQIERAADALVRSLTNGGAFWVYGIGHGGEQELTGRAGGLMATRIFSFGFQVSSPIAQCRQGRPRAETFEADLEQIRLAVRSSEMRAGDVLMLASVSGRNRAPVELTLAARDAGVTVIGLTSLEYTGQVESLHPSGKKLCDVADIVIDNCAPFGDACVAAEGYEHNVLPISGIANVTIAWMVCAEVMERTAALGKPAHAYISHNRPGGAEYNERAMQEYNEVGW